MKIIKEFKPLWGKHCVTNSLKRIFNFYGYSITEEMLFGIGTGLSFVYVALARSPIISGRTKTADSDERIANRLNVSIRCRAIAA
jgi:hypothetical protein